MDKDDVLDSVPAHLAEVAKFDVTVEGDMARIEGEMNGTRETVRVPCDDEALQSFWQGVTKAI